MLEIKDNEEFNSLAEVALSKCYEYWKLYMELCIDQNVRFPAVVWLQNDETGHMMCFTRGEYSEDLKEFIENLYKM